MMMRILRILVCVVLVMGGAATLAAPSSAATTATISGHLTGPGGDPVGGSVSPWRKAANGQWKIAPHHGGWADWDAETGEYGYTLTGLEAGTYLLMFTPDEFDGPDLAPHFLGGAVTPGSAHLLSVGAGESRTGIDAQFAVGKTISGKVTGLGGRPLDAHVRASLRFNADGTLSFGAAADTDPATGIYTLRGLPAGAYVVHFESDGYVSEMWKKTYDEGKTTPVTVPAANIDTQMTAYGAISGTVKVPKGMRPRVYVEAFGELSAIGQPGRWGFSGHALANSSGRYTVGELLPGRHRLRFEFIGVSTRSYAREIIVRPGVTTTGVNLTFGRVKPNLVVKASGGRKKAKVTVQVKPTMRTAHGSGTKATGKVTVTVAGKKVRMVLKNGRATVTVKKLKKGKRTVKVTYSGNVLYRAGTKKAKVKVR